MTNKYSVSDTTVDVDENITLAQIREELNRPESLEEERNALFPHRKKKYDTRWKQQKNIACRQHCTFFQVLVFYLTLGVTFIGIGMLCYFSTKDIPPAFRIDYTDCEEVADKHPCYEKNETPETKKDITCECERTLSIGDDSYKSKTLIVYYELVNFYQNVRSYKTDVDWHQLEGKSPEYWSDKPVEPECKYKYFRKGKSGKYIYPCGKIANSFFSDEFEIENINTESTLRWETDKIAWKSDLTRFKKPSTSNSELMTKFEFPRDWHPQLNQTFLESGGVENQHFIVWMRSAAFSTFRKKYAVIKGIAKGEYKIKIKYRFDVKSFKGRKRIVIKVDEENKPTDNFFFRAYMGVGIVCLAFGPLFCLFKCIFKNAIQRRDEQFVEQSKESFHTLRVPADQSARSSQNVTEAPSATGSI